MEHFLLVVAPDDVSGLFQEIRKRYACRMTFDFPEAG
jgi:hypothetical protein